ncbi:MAG: hypothetical protein J5449_06175 [Oscillospiraceae bacterium]|nr:hypothetical protein [Oscillospiraceae bacterium]
MRELQELKLYVWNTDMSDKVPVSVVPASQSDLKATKDWQTRWTSTAAKEMPNKVALHRTDDGELLGLMSYEIDHGALAVEIIYIESAAHSNANLLHATGGSKKYIGVARALIAYAAKASVDAGFDGVLFFKAKTDELRKYYMQEFGAMPVGRYDPYRLVIWEDAAANILSDFEEV